ncbi:hypothetical protein ABZT17_25200 [Streptomyces sp. NPDC005648]|uniref:hypothetical protein n=1 Tax=Streptomyces sp. NPDC005648 TaxID=3157044 RepID=UPI0033AEBF43
MTFNPSRQAARNGFPGDLDTTNHAAQMNQFLGTPEMICVYPGAQVLTPNGTTFSWTDSASLSDYDQPFVLSGTTVGRVTVPVQVQGAGSDLTVSLCPDAAGAPDLSSPLARTVVPAAWLQNLGVGGQLASPQFASLQFTGSTASGWLVPAGSPTANATAPSTVTSGSFTVLLGGDANSVDTAVSNVAICQFDGSALGLPKAGPPLPQGVVTGGALATSDTIVSAGGSTKLSSGTALNAVYCASWDPNTGTVGTWSNQTSLPGTVVQPATASYDGTMYVIGGFTDSSSATALSSVYFTKVSNGSVNTWSSATPLPVARGNMFAAAVNGWLIVTGGINASVTVSGTTYFAKIAGDGSLGPWYVGPTLPVPVYASNSQALVVGDFVVVVSGTDASSDQTSTIQVLPVSAEFGPASAWRVTNDPNIANTYFAAGFSFDELGNGAIAVTDILNSRCYVYAMVPVSLVSVPVPATGLTNGAIYHVVLHQHPTQVPTVDFLEFGAGVGGLATNFQSRAVGSSGAWSADSSRSLLMSVHDQTVGGQQPLHTWEDPGSDNLAAAVSTFLWDYRGELLGYVQGIAFPNEAQNSNSTFVSGTSPWTATNCTLTQSSAQTHGGFTESGLITPNGTSAIVYAQSELIRVTPGSWYQAQGWLYSATGWSDVSLSVSWFDANQTLISTSGNTVSLTAATWTQQINNFQAPSGAAYAALAPTEGSTPGATALLYLSNITLTDMDGGTLASVARVDYGFAPGAPVGITQLN